MRDFTVQSGDQYAVMLFNLALTATHTVTLQLPTVPSATANLHTLTGANIRASNEETEEVSIQTSQIDDLGQSYALRLAPHSAYVLEWQAAAAQHAVYLPIVMESDE